ncbi:hypothetical protein ACHAXS_002565 [Conticribra weissflogii]
MVISKVVYQFLAEFVEGKDCSPQLGCKKFEWILSVKENSGNDRKGSGWLITGEAKKLSMTSFGSQ